MVFPFLNVDCDVPDHQPYQNHRIQMELFFSLFGKKFKGIFALIGLIGLFNSSVTSGFMILVTKAVSNHRFLDSKQAAIMFIILFVTCVLFNRLFYNQMIKLSSQIICNVELELLDRLRKASFTSFSSIDKEEIYSAINKLGVLGDAPTRFVNIFNAFLTLIGCVIYLSYTSITYGFVLIIMVGFLIGTFVTRSKMRKANYEVLRKIEIQYYKYLSDLLDGFKDIKMSSVKNETLYKGYIGDNRNQAKLIDIKLKQNSSNSTLLANYTWYLALGVVLFILPLFNGRADLNVSTFILVLIYSITPVAHLTNFFSFNASLTSAAKVLIQIYEKLNEADKYTDGGDKHRFDPLSKISFNNAMFHYEKGSNDFKLGPINVELHKGEITFVTGGNGSGKSTFLNILAGLQELSSGTMCYDNISISADLFQDYRNKISAVFIEAYLMNQDYEAFELNSKNRQFTRYLELFKMPANNPIDHLFEQKHALSKGQQKRLSLILALLMNREILLLDEWAAEQDPEFRKYFYETVLPILREEGRTIVAITHDDQYLSLADRVLKFRDGQILSDIKNNNPLAETIAN